MFYDISYFFLNQSILNKMNTILFFFNDATTYHSDVVIVVGGHSVAQRSGRPSHVERLYKW